MPGPIDWLVLTAAHRRQAKAYASQLAARGERGPLARVRGMLVVPDARDARIGSGAATVLALVQVARQIVQARAAKGRTVGSLEEIFAGERVLMLHSGGDSRRLPMYAAEGKLFASVPKRAAGGRCATVFDVLLGDLLALSPRSGGEILVGAGDAVLGIARDPVRFAGAGVIGVAQRAGVERAVRHGVFVRGKSAAGGSAADQAGGDVAAFLQKPSVAELEAAGALAADGLALVDTGLLSLDPASVAALLTGAGVRLARSGEVVCDKGGLADLASRAELPPIDLYREIMMALPATTRRADYLAACASAASERPLAALFDGLRGVPFRVEVAEISGFLHVGSTREMLASLVGGAGGADSFGMSAVSVPCAPRSQDGAGEAVVLESRVDALRVEAGRAFVDRVRAHALRLGGGNVVVGVDCVDDLALPAGVSLFGLPVHEQVDVLVACGERDDFKTRLDAGGTLLDVPFADFAARAGIEASECVAGDGTLWDARLWCAAGSDDALSRVRWMWDGAPAPAEWRAAPRLSLRELVEHADLEEIAARRDALTLEALADDAVGALVVAADASDARAVHERLAESDDEVRALVLRDADARTAGLADPIARAHACATLSVVAHGVDASASDMLRARAFRSVGDAVLSRFDLPAEPRAAAILHDQAVWTSTPVRIDLAGGWSDTPPICNEVGGSVVNVAVMLRGQLPIQVVAKLEEEPVIRITSTDAGQTREIRSMDDLAHRGDPTRWSSLAESALVLTGIVPADPRASLGDWLARLGGGISLTMFSAVPKGSGLGTSSILGAATIQCLDRVVGRERAPHGLFAATSALEQMLSTRGGWQDQVGGVLGGFKIARTAPGAEQRPEVEPIAVPDSLVRALRERSLLYFTGERRMAKNILENVVWNWLVHEPAAVRAVDRLRANAERMRHALASGDIDAVVGELTEYMRRKRQIDPGSCPKAFDTLAERWKAELGASGSGAFGSGASGSGASRSGAWCFAGAGGGGFMLLVARDADAAASLRARIERDPPHPRARAFDLEVDPVGLRCAVL